MKYTDGFTYFLQPVPDHSYPLFFPAENKCGKALHVYSIWMPVGRRKPPLFPREKKLSVVIFIWWPINTPWELGKVPCYPFEIEAFLCNEPQYS